MPARYVFGAVICVAILTSGARSEETPMRALQESLRPSWDQVIAEGDTRLEVDSNLGSPFSDHGAETPSTTTETLSTSQELPSERSMATELDAVDAACSTCSRCSRGEAECGCQPCMKLTGWMSAGYHSQSNQLFNHRPHELALHQGWISLEREARSHLDLGFRVDAMYGIDANETQAFGNPSGTWDFENGFDHGAYGWAIPQAYLETVVHDWKLKIGHFYTLIGYEVVTAPDNFFYSHAITMFNTEPFTHTGLLASRQFGSLEVFAGWTAGWDTGFERFADGSSWLGGARYSLNEDATLAWITTAGNFGRRGDDGYGQSLVLETNLTDRLQWILQSDLLRVDSTGEDNVGVNQYLLYGLCDWLGIGARLEWWKGDVLTGYAPHGAVLPSDGSLSYYAATLGLNLTPRSDVVVRPEIRHDWSPAAGYDETYFGVDAILTF